VPSLPFHFTFRLPFHFPLPLGAFISLVFLPNYA
jgi:hypothetical protein